MNQINNKYQNIQILEILFFWLRLFYTKSKGVGVIYLMFFFIPQKIFRINGFVKWPVHFTSRINNVKKIKVGNRSCPGMNSGCYIQAKNGIVIGDNLRMGPNVGLISANHSISDYDAWEIAPPIELGNNVWLGMGVVVLPGVRIGDNVVIASNSVVNKDIPPNVIAGGIPCRVIKDKPPYQGVNYSEFK